MDKIDLSELEQVAMPLVELLRKKGDPHTMVVVSDRRVDLYQGIAGTPMDYDD